jgi:hypothetical protein
MCSDMFPSLFLKRWKEFFVKNISGYDFVQSRDQATPNAISVSNVS